MSRSFVLILGWLACPLVGAVEPVQFNRDIRPFLSNTCFHCHGPDAKTREAGLRLDMEEPAKEDLGGYAAIVSGDAKASEAMHRILTDDPDDQMPPPESGLSLTPEQKALFRRWIDEGAIYQRHWAFEPIQRPESRGNVIDSLVREELKGSGLAPSEPASAETQLRRVSLDLTGLPPSIEEVDAFLVNVDNRGLDAAYESMVDRLIQSPRYGERMAWQWLEAARYADTDGYQNDGPREMWRWRDWVIDAYNANMPFDQFTVEQLAGDLLPKPTHQQLIATAFNRNHRYNSEEGIPIDEFLLENAVDRVDTTSTIWMGLTMGCARCHDHKYDPFSQKEYYQLIDYFNDVAESGRAVKFGNSEPWIKTPTDNQRRHYQKLVNAVNKRKAAIEEAESAIATAQSAWLKELRQIDPVLTHGLDHHYRFEQASDSVKLKSEGARLAAGVDGHAAEVSGNGWFELEKVEGLIGNGRFSVSFWMKPGQVKSGPVLSNEMPGTGRNGILVEFVDGHLRWNNNTRWISGVSTVETKRTFKPGEWFHITLTNDGTQRAAGMAMYVDGERAPVKVIRNTNSNKAKRNQGTEMRIGYSKHAGHWQGAVDELRFYTTRTLAPDEVRILSVRASPLELARMSEAGLTEAQRALLRRAYLEQGGNPRHQALLSLLEKAEDARVANHDKLPTTMITRDLPVGRPSFVRERGVYDALGERVGSGVPDAFPELPRGEKNNRLGFAKWLVSGEHPLTARVTANRYWQLFFGRGLVKTAEDFGSQGDLPSHPKLLDWLASELIESDWDIRHVLKAIVMSATYRQSSNVTPEQQRIDPENVLLSRAPRLRLPGNVLRDQALAVSGLLVEEQGGPSVYPYQPKGLWSEASNAKYTQGKGRDLYRRSLYTYWKRTLAPPTMAVLDTGDREYCTVKPKRTNTPLQALTLMNDVTFVEASRKLAERMLVEGGTTDVDRVTFGFRTVATRRPTDREVTLLRRALDGYRAEFERNLEAAEATLTVGESKVVDGMEAKELAAHTALANVLLNLDEVTTRE
jgi:hypothetical protein